MTQAKLSAVASATTVDVLIVGGGSSGSALAARLSEDSSCQVMVLEAGGKNADKLTHIPLLSIALASVFKLRNWAYETVPQLGFRGRRGYQPRGKGLGGSSAVNAMVYTRGNPADYDRWEAMGNPGWGWKSLAPLFKASETNHCVGETNLRGVHGPLQVSYLPSPSSMNEAFHEACALQGIPRNPDYNGAQQFGVGSSQTTTLHGERFSASRAYLEPNLHRPNLRIETGCLVHRVLFEGKRAVGVEFEQAGMRRIVRARREVVLCAGAFGSPAVLLRSGVGPKAELDRHGIPMVHELPGVGENLQDHLSTVLIYYSDRKDAAVGFSLRGFWDNGVDVIRWFFSRKGRVTSNVSESQAFFHTEGRNEHPNIQLAMCIGMVDDHLRKPHWGHGYTLHVTLMHPESRGTVRLASIDPKADPEIDFRYLDKPADMARLKTALRKGYEIMESAPFDAYRDRLLYPLDPSSDASLESFIRDNSDTEYHPVGTCKMGPASDPMAVVDASLRVHGLEGLRVVDASIMPTISTGNTNAICVVIGERAAQIMKAKAECGHREELAA